MRTSLGLALLLSACAGDPRRPDVSDPALGAPLQPGTVEANWKERLEQPYVYLEHRGDYRELAPEFDRLRSQSKELEQRGPPFVLFYDDPGHVPVDELRARICIPVRERPTDLDGLAYDVLPRAMVVYTRVEGNAERTARSYPELFSYLRELGWQAGGPVREVYLTDSARTDGRPPLTEIQIPWAARVE